MGPKGDPGLACWDLNGDGIQDPGEDINLDGLWYAADCHGPQGETGPVANRQFVPEANKFTTLDSAGQVGLYTSITIRADGLPIISYNDTTNDHLKVAHCANVFCTPYFRRR